MHYKYEKLFFLVLKKYLFYIIFIKFRKIRFYKKQFFRL